MIGTMFARLKNGFAIMVQAFSLMHEHKAFYWFAGLLMFSYAAIMGALASCAVYLLRGTTWTHTTQTVHGTVYHGTIEPTVMLNFISSFLMILLAHALWKNLLEIAISTYAAAAMHQNYSQLHMSKALWSALKASWYVLCWVLFDTTIGLAIGAISGKRENDRFSILDAIRHMVGSLLSMAWSVCTFLVPQVIAFERRGAFSSIRTSFALIKKTFGETLSANFMFSFFYSAIGIVVILLVALFAPLITQVTQASSSLPLFPVLIISLILCLAAFASAALTVARIIFKTSVYFYAKDNECLGFDASLITQSFR